MAKSWRLKVNMIIGGTCYPFGTVLEEKMIPPKYRTPAFTKDPEEPEPPPMFPANYPQLEETDIDYGQNQNAALAPRIGHSF